MKKRYRLPTEEEDKAICEAILQDIDTRTVKYEEFKSMQKYRGRPLSLITKEKIMIPFFRYRYYGCF